MERKMNDWVGNLIAFLAVLVVNYLSNALPIGGQTPKDVSDKYPTLFTPESFTFAIWGIIYLAIAAFVIYQALPAQRHNRQIARISPWFQLSCVANIAWIFCWHYELLALSMLVMLGLLTTLIMVYCHLHIATRPAPLHERLLLQLPFSLYLGWISVAAIANLSVLQTAYGLENFEWDAVSWTLLKLALVTAITAVVITLRRDWVYGLVIAWAAFGIMMKQVATPVVAGAATSLIMTVLLLLTFMGIRYLLAKTS